jgi:predicted  nucleic acid-binding Zn-ribbon protein
MNPDQLTFRCEELRKDHLEIQELLGRKEKEVEALNREMRKLLANFENASAPAASAVKKFEKPGSISAQTREFDQKLKAQEVLVQALLSELSRAQQAVGEYK